MLGKVARKKLILNIWSKKFVENISIQNIDIYIIITVLNFSIQKENVFVILILS